MLPAEDAVVRGSAPSSPRSAVASGVTVRASSKIPVFGLASPSKAGPALRSSRSGAAGADTANGQDQA
jgi:hypothetical protein